MSRSPSFAAQAGAAASKGPVGEFAGNHLSGREKFDPARPLDPGLCRPILPWASSVCGVGAG
jgi:hypothetical protein